MTLFRYALFFHLTWRHRQYKIQFRIYVDQELHDIFILTSYMVVQFFFVTFFKYH